MDSTSRPSIPSLHQRNGSTTKLDTSTTKTPTRRMTLDRTISSPPITPVSPGSQTTSFQDARLQSQPRSLIHDLLTPPTSPLVLPSESAFSSLRPASRSGVSFVLPQESEEKPSIDGFIFGSQPVDESPVDDFSLLEYSYELEHVRDATGKCVEYGSGAWSTVYKCVSRPGSRYLEEPAVEVTTTFRSLSPLVVAVKTPHRKDGVEILRSEAHTLSYLSRLRRSEDRVVPFHGYVLDTGSLVMSAVPLSLADHITHCNTEMRSMYKRSARSAPVVGSESLWLALATRLIDSLQWLHDVAGVIHGDIKPHNILLRPNEPEAEGDSSYQISSTNPQALPFTPVFVDFSSSHIIHSPVRSPGALSAVTPQYTAPELLSSKVLRDPTSLPTTPSDVFSLAVTLLVCATGDLNVYPAPTALHRQAMAQQGWSVLGFAKNGDGGMRVPRGGVVERTLEKAVLKAGMGRCDAREWKNLVRDRAREMMENDGPTKVA